MNINIDGKAIEELRKLLEYPPYLIFVLVGLILVAASLVWGNNFYQVWIFFLYSIIGSIWRYIEKDIYKNIFKTERQKAVIIIVYHLGNIGLFIALLHYLKLI